MYAIQQLDGILSDFHSLWASGKDLLSDIEGSFDAHGLEALINGLSQPNRRYVGNDLIYSVRGGSRDHRGEYFFCFPVVLDRVGQL